MSRVVILGAGVLGAGVLGAGVSGHTAALHLRRRLGKEHEVLVVSSNSQWNWIPSNIWVGVGRTSAVATDSSPSPGDSWSSTSG